MTQSICIRYTLVLIGTIVLIGIISLILETYFQIDIGSVGGIISIMIPAMDAGMAYYNKAGEAPSTQTRWAFARYFTAIQIILAAIILAFLWSFIPELSELASSVGLVVLAIFMAIYLIIIFLTSRYFFGLGINNAEKVAKKIANK